MGRLTRSRSAYTKRAMDYWNINEPYTRSFAGNNSSTDVSETSMEPSIAYVTKAESTYDWKAESWSVSIHFKVEQLLKAGSQMIQVGGGLRYSAASPSDGPEGLGARLSLIFLFPQ